MTPYKKLTEQIELKGLGWHTLHSLLDKYGWELWVNRPPWYEGENNYYFEKNRKAVEQALIEIDFII
jgi:hypothetical protein